MALKPVICTQCHGHVQVEDTRDCGFCMYCGTKILIAPPPPPPQIQQIQPIVSTPVFNIETTGHVIDYMKNGETFLTLGEFKKAGDAFEKAVDNDPGNYKGWFGLASSASNGFTLNEKIPESVVTNLEKALKLVPDDEKEGVERALKQYSEKIAFQREEEKRKENEARIRDTFAFFISGAVTGYSDVRARANGVNTSGNIKIPDGVMGIGHGCFADAKSELTYLNAFYIPTSVAWIGEKSFAGLDNLRTIYFEEKSNLSRIGKEAFAGCKSLRDITLPAEVAVIEAGAFGYCDELTTVFFGDSRENAFDANKSKLEKIGIGAFYLAKKLSNITLPETLVSIGPEAFYYCTNLRGITIPNSVMRVGQKAFAGWDKGQTIFVNKRMSKRWDKNWKEACKAKIVYR
ncbi:MAG: leucine-rich repeat domain-containing protein [Firmicutes bacterium]|nr:leucine-rich repeat domain-containing protein [Bacillota bacterium]